MESTVFHAAFDQVSTPALLRTSDRQWLMNPAAQEASISPLQLDQMEALRHDATLWLNRRFYNATVTSAGEDTLILLQPDDFLSRGGRSVASQLRHHLSAAFDPIVDLSESESIRRDEEAKDSISALNKALYQILRLVRQLDLSADSPLFCSRQHTCDLVAMLEHFRYEVAPLCASAGITLEILSEPDVSVATADSEMLEQLFLQLIANSLKVISAGGTISIRLKEQGDYAVFTYTDGTSSLSLQSMSDPLWNQPELVLHQRGLGLGLAIAQRIAAAHSGSLVLVTDDAQPQAVLSIPLNKEEILFQSPNLRFESYAGFSPAKIALADSLPASVYSPFLDEDD